NNAGSDTPALRPSRGFDILSAVVWREEIQFGPKWNDATRVEVAHPAVITELDRGYVDGVGDPRHLKNLARIIRQVVIVCEPAPVALEVAVIDSAEPHEGRKQPEIRLGETVADEIALAAEPLFEAVERREELAERLLVGALGPGKAAAVNPIVNRVVNKTI